MVVEVTLLWKLVAREVLLRLRPIVDLWEEYQLLVVTLL
jgi:hypothetical protein